MDVSGPRLPEGREVGKRRDLAARFVVAPFDPLELGLSFGKGLFLSEMPCDAAADLPGRALLPLRFDRLVKRQDGGGVAVGAARGRDVVRFGSERVRQENVGVAGRRVIMLSQTTMNSHFEVSRRISSVLFESLCWLMSVLPPELTIILMSWPSVFTPRRPSWTSSISLPRTMASVQRKHGIVALTGLVPTADRLRARPCCLPAGRCSCREGRRCP